MIMKMPENNSPEKRVIQVNDNSFVHTNENLKELEALGYGDLDIEGAPNPTEDEYDKMLGEERKLRKMLWVDVFGKTPNEVAQLISDNNLKDILLQWFEIHMRNKAIYIKKGEGDILVIPTTQTLLKAAKILR